MNAMLLVLFGVYLIFDRCSTCSKCLTCSYFLFSFIFAAFHTLLPIIDLTMLVNLSVV